VRADQRAILREGLNTIATGACRRHQTYRPGAPACGQARDSVLAGI